MHCIIAGKTKLSICNRNVCKKLMFIIILWTPDFNHNRQKVLKFVLYDLYERRDLLQNGLSLLRSSLIRRKYHPFIEDIKCLPSDFISTIYPVLFMSAVVKKSFKIFLDPDGGLDRHQNLSLVILQTNKQTHPPMT